jgi:metal-responsive CopG/Arc/MetJ family transcriptional regulator
VAYRKPVTISLPPPLLKEVERRAKQQHQTTSELVREALRRYLSEAEADAAWQRALAYGRRRAKQLGLRTDEQVEEYVNQMVHEYRHGVRSPSTARRR